MRQTVQASSSALSIACATWRCPDRGAHNREPASDGGRGARVAARGVLAVGGSCPTCTDVRPFTATATSLESCLWPAARQLRCRSITSRSAKSRVTTLANGQAGSLRQAVLDLLRQHYHLRCAALGIISLSSQIFIDKNQASWARRGQLTLRNVAGARRQAVPLTGSDFSPGSDLGSDRHGRHI